jgi:hypothetical protein
MKKKSSFHASRFVIVLSLLLCASPVWAHSLNYALENAPAQQVIGYYSGLGFRHIIPDGFDHILFVAGLCLLSTDIKPILWQATAFTLAHSITLALSMNNLFAAPPALIEPVISLSILFIAVENLLLKELRPWRIAIVFFFGLVHGLGFANALNETGLPPGKFFTSLAAFNAGVEAGQIAIILLLFGCIIIPLRQNRWYEKRVVYPLSLLIALVAGYWTWQRL